MSARLAAVMSLLVASTAGVASAIECETPALTLTPPADLDAGALRVTRFADGLSYPMGVVELSDGSLAVATNVGAFFISSGEIVRLVDIDDDGVADGPPQVLATGLPGQLTGMATFEGFILVASAASNDEQILVLRTGATASDPLTTVGAIDFDLPSGHLHKTTALATRSLGAGAMGGAGELYFQLGSRFNQVATVEGASVSGLTSGPVQPDALSRVSLTLNGGVLSVGAPELIATGLRNAAGLVFDSAGDLYIGENGIDTPGNVGESFSADELNVIDATSLGGTVEDFGFPSTYVEYRTGTTIGTTGIAPVVAFTPIPDPIDGAEAEGVASIAPAPSGFPPPLDRGFFLGFHGVFSRAGVENEENPLVHVDPASGTYTHVIATDVEDFGHPDGLYATDDALFVVDLSSAGLLNVVEPSGVIYRISRAIGPACECACAYDGDEVIGIGDLLAFLGFWFAGDPRAELDGDASDVTVADLLAFLACWFDWESLPACNAP